LIHNALQIWYVNPEEWPKFLEEYDYKIIEDVEVKDLTDKYMNPTGRKLSSTPIERIIFAEKV